jgi:hypothetical protein
MPIAQKKKLSINLSLDKVAQKICPRGQMGQGLPLRSRSI